MYLINCTFVLTGEKIRILVFGLSKAELLVCLPY
jgi:hypothetical protein